MTTIDLDTSPQPMRIYQARTVFGYPVGAVSDQNTAEQTLESIGLSYLAERWLLAVDARDEPITMYIVEATPARSYSTGTLPGVITIDLSVVPLILTPTGMCRTETRSQPRPLLLYLLSNLRRIPCRTSTDALTRKSIDACSTCARTVRSKRSMASIWQTRSGRLEQCDQLHAEGSEASQKT